MMKEDYVLLMIIDLLGLFSGKIHPSSISNLLVLVYFSLMREGGCINLFNTITMELKPIIFFM